MMRSRNCKHCGGYIIDFGRGHSVIKYMGGYVHDDCHLKHKHTIQQIKDIVTTRNVEAYRVARMKAHRERMMAVWELII